ncbi:MAG: anti-phage ZorAB system protein ZorA, partial [Flavobacteriales bacterium]
MPNFFEYINSMWMSILAFINSYMNAYFGIELPSHAIIIFILICILFLFFLFLYFIPAISLGRKLGGLKKDLEVFKQENLLEYPSKLFDKRGKLFNHLWTEYEQTLHKQRRINPQTGVEELIAIRSTAPAEMFFSPSVLVDSQLHIEFFKHLPGILTGLGIIGTFLGLIHGLQAFRVDENTEIVRQSLDQLLHGVYGAFLVSMVAIALAMFVTLIEKFLFSKLYRKVEELCFLIDSFYVSGAGEEYLERLVKSSEDSASQANIIKDSLVGELKDILREITHQQIQSALTSQQQLGDKFKETIEAGISQPLQKIADGFNDQREHTGRDLSSALNDVFAGFTQRLQDLFGGQTTGIYDLQQKTIEALQAAIQQFQQMASQIDTTGRNTTSAMTETLAEAMKAMESHQQMMNDQMMEFLGQIRTMSQTGQAETEQKLQTLLGDLGQQMTRMVAELQVQSRAANDDHQGRQQQMAETTIAAISRLSSGVETSLQTMKGQLTGMLDHLKQQTQSTAEQNTEQQRQLAQQNQQAVQALTSSVDQTVSKISSETTDLLIRLTTLVEGHQNAAADAVRSIQTAITKMSEVTTSALARMNQGAENLILATDDFSKAGQS